MKIKGKKLSPDAVIPTRATDGSAGFDLVACKMGVQIGEDNVPVLIYDTQVSVEIPKGYVGIIAARSSISTKSLTLANSIGVIDSDYRGPIMVKFKLNTNANPIIYKEGDKIAQLVVIPHIYTQIEEVDELSETERGEGGFGSTDKKENKEQDESGRSEEQAA